MTKLMLEVLWQLTNCHSHNGLAGCDKHRAGHVWHGHRTASYAVACSLLLASSALAAPPTDTPEAKPVQQPDAPQSITTLTQLGAQLKLADGHVVEVSLQSKKIADDDLAALHGLPHLETLNLYETPITDAGLRQLKSLKTLKSLNLGFCRNITDAGIKELKDLKELEFLNLGFCRKLTAEGFRVLPRFEKLRTLNLSITSFGDDQAELLPKLIHLENLDLDNTRVTDGGLTHVSKLKKLRYLRLVGTRVTDRGLETVAKLPNLRFLHIRDTFVSDSGVTAFQSALPKCRVIR